MTTRPTTTPSRDELRAMPIRDVVERWPDALTILAPFGIDLCCGGAHPLAEALQLHGIPEDAPVDAILALASRETASR
jgi:iron-sulfur cluster repair protein YtfE (RIC family)